MRRSSIISSIQSFDHLKTSLDGCKLIESSAGTGKTYAIASLFVRLLLEKRLEVHQILVVTFTEAATAELRDRIRGKLRDAARAFEKSSPGPDEFLKGLLQETPNPEDARALLTQALYSFDQAAIFTIHGFCQKVLQENAFESSSAFNTELITDQASICQEIIDDFWRKNFYKASPALVGHALKSGLTEDLSGLLATSISNPMLKLIPEITKPDLTDVEIREKRIQALYDALEAAWKQGRTEVESIFESDKNLKGISYPRASIPGYLEEMEDYCVSGDPLRPPKHFAWFTSSGIKDRTRKNCAPPVHRFFNACEDLSNAVNDLKPRLDECLLALKLEFLRYAKNELKKRKARRNVRSFDDLLLDLHVALQKTSGRKLASSLRLRFKAALIDEFQDTDPIQYEIFTIIFGHNSSLFLIGDPKQAIYSFRGADIFTYMKAASDIEDRYTLSRNWRTEQRLVEAVNSIFSFQGAGLPFIFPEIGFSKSQSALEACAPGFAWDGKPDPSPLKIWFVRREDDAAVKAMPKGEFSKLLPGLVATEVVRLVNAGRQGRAFVEGKAVAPWHIAVLVRTNNQAREVQEALRKRNVPTVVYGTGSVFHTPEAEELGRILYSIAEPGNQGLLKAALATDILGVTGAELACFAEDDAGWNERLTQFADYKNLWVGKGFILMIRSLLSQEEVRRRLLAFQDGERRLTNLLHCIELLQDASVREKLGVDGLLKWLSLRLQEGNENRSDEQQIRLETDEKALKVITVHRSKGLEFPIVFCPYAWDTFGTDPDTATFHDEEDRTILIKDLGSSQRAIHKAIEEKEALAEQCRLFYVALTRAKYRCYVWWGAVNGAEISAPAALLHCPENPDPSSLPESVRAGFKGLTDTQMLASLCRLVRRSNGTIELPDLPDDSPQPYLSPAPETGSLAARQFNGTIPADWGAASFSGLTSGESHTADAPDHDALSPGMKSGPETLPSPATRSILDFPRGARAGTMLHKIFEELDFTAAREPATEELVREKLASFGFDPVWLAPVCRMVCNVVSTPLNDSSERILLGQLPRQNRLNELEFSFPISRIAPEALADMFSAHQSEAIPISFTKRLASLRFIPIKGLMKGFIDLTFEWKGRFYILDWKSNYLGPQVEDYGQASMQNVMENSLYILQYHLYAVALHRYLTFRLGGYDYEKHFGGIFYLFLRGIDPAHGSKFGIYADRPAATLIKELSSRLSG